MANMLDQRLGKTTRERYFPTEASGADAAVPPKSQAHDAEPWGDAMAEPTHTPQSTKWQVGRRSEETLLSDREIRTIVNQKIARVRAQQPNQRRLPSRKVLLALVPASPPRPRSASQ
jgi:hypothetical protein